VGDNFARDVEGTRNAGFGMVIIMPDKDDKDMELTPEQTPDMVIERLTDLLKIFPSRVTGK